MRGFLVSNFLPLIIASSHFHDYWTFANISRYSLTDLNGLLEVWAATCISDSEDVGDDGIGHDGKGDLLMNMMMVPMKMMARMMMEMMMMS